MKINNLYQRIFFIIAFSIHVSSCSIPTNRSVSNDRLKVAQQIFSEHCKNSGEKIYKTENNIEGILLLKLRREGINYDNQFALDDPYGADLLGTEGYITSFLDGIFGKVNVHEPKSEAPLRNGYSYVDAIDPRDNKLYHYTGSIEEPWQTNKSYLKGFSRFKLNKFPIERSTASYGITFDDISTVQDREYWIAGSSLKIIDLKTHEIIAERVGYMMDRGQGSKVGGRSPWLLAANNACPSFFTRQKTSQSGPGSLAQTYQAANFSEKVLQPKSIKKENNE